MQFAKISLHAPAAPSDGGARRRPHVNCHQLARSDVMSRDGYGVAIQAALDTTDVTALLEHWDGESAPVSYMREDLVPAGGSRSFTTTKIPCAIKDARLLATGADEGDLGLDTSGFELVYAPTALGADELCSASAITSRYYDECAALIQRITGARHCVPFDHNVRSSKVDLFIDSSPKEGDPSGPVMFVHNDYTDLSGPQRVLELARHVYELPEHTTLVLQLRAASHMCTPRKFNEKNALQWNGRCGAA